MDWRTPGLIGFWLIGVAAAACGRSGDIAGVGGACVTDADCPAGDVCDFGTCRPGLSTDTTSATIGPTTTGPTTTTTGIPDVPDTGCTENLDCPPGQICLDGECEFPIDCVENTDCLDTEVCYRGECICIRACASCVSDVDCGPGQRCTPEGFCTGSGQCIRDDQCRDAYGCVDGACVPVVECVTNLQCDTGQICVVGFCDGGIECLDNHDCLTGEYCQNGGCRPYEE